MKILKPNGLPLLFVGLLAACASPSPAPVLLTLPPATPLMASAAPAGSAATAPLLAVRRINIPEYLVARRVRYRADASTLAEWPNTFWAERVEIGVSRELVSALRRQLPGWALCDTNCGDAVPTLSLQVDLVPMDFLRSDKRLHAHARLVLSSGGVPARELNTLELAYELPVGGDTPQHHAQAISELIRQVAEAAAPFVRDATR